MAKILIQPKDIPVQIKASLPSKTNNSFLDYVQYTATENKITDMKHDEIASYVLKEIIEDFISRDKDYQTYLKELEANKAKTTPRVE